MQNDNELRSFVLISEKLEKELENAGCADERRRYFRIAIEDGNTRRRVRFPLPGLIGPWFYLRLCGLDQVPGLASRSIFKLRLKLLRSSLFRGLQKKPLAAAQWLGAGSIVQCERPEAKPLLTLAAAELRRLQGMIRQVERVECELEKLIGPVKDMMSLTLEDPGAMHENLGRAASELAKFRKRASLLRSRTDLLEFLRNRSRPFWMFRPPAIAYALFRLLTEHSEPRLLRKDAYRRIGTFEREYLGRKSRGVESDPEDTVRRQVYTFKKGANRKDMDRILKRLLAGEWYCLDHRLNRDWENPNALPYPSR